MATELPLDVQILIIEWLFRSSQHALIDYATLRACAIVCRAWTPVAQRLLFRRLRCLGLQDPQSRIRLLVDTLRTRLHLAAHVRYIEVAWPSYPRDFGDVCLHLLELCRQVEAISFWLSNHNNKPLSADLDAHLRAIQLRPMVLEMIGLDDTVCRTIVNIFPGARVLVFNVRQRYDGPYECLLPSTVEALEIPADSLRQCLSLSEPLPALRHLSLLLPDWSDKALCEHLNYPGLLQQLQSLQIKGNFPPEEILKPLVQLRTLIVEELPRKPVTLPPSLRHIGYHAWWNAAPGALAELAVDPLRALPELQLVTVTRAVKPHVRLALEEMCRENGVHLGTYEMPFFFRKQKHIDWI
ncbi:hypothetical protein FA95DRAFT_1602180 [Auriscalpium vulgare]|uniref:Uncharacterized protein n=1 Tax=Auriscalpium vulgare TaxID=40419 RepID=A0ACB8S749_9AGAM|nr:hypothetical protein FA95DRAFT_1602180 [Auriscalpium vulgare]